jgi:hypothetical protein
VAVCKEDNERVEWRWSLSPAREVHSTERRRQTSRFNCRRPITPGDRAGGPHALTNWTSPRVVLRTAGTDAGCLRGHKACEQPTRRESCVGARWQVWREPRTISVASWALAARAMLRSNSLRPNWWKTLGYRSVLHRRRGSPTLSPHDDDAGC